MCGILFSIDNKKITDLDALKRRGPDGFQAVENNLGYFVHSHLNTIGESIVQPLKTKFGYLLYNGSTYNSKNSNDTKWLGDQLDDKIENSIELIRSLRGEYALIYVTETHILFCTDQFYQRNLWFYFNGEKKEITISTIQKNVKDKHNAAWYCEENKIYIIDKLTWKIKTMQNKFWNFTQHVDHFDHVIDKFELAVSDRHNVQNTTNLQSSGIDSGMINCVCLNLFKNHKAIIDATKENNQVIADRLKKHKFSVVKYNGEQPEKVQIFQKIYDSYEVFLCAETDPLINLCRTVRFHHNNRVLVTGNGGDEIFSDKTKENHPFCKARLNGAFPVNLELVWPWHNQPNDRMYLGNQRFDYIAGWFGIEVRNPFLDQDLVQAWLNTTSRLKNTKFKAWIIDYMRKYDYPYTLEKYHFNQDDYVKPNWLQ